MIFSEFRRNETARRNQEIYDKERVLACQIATAIQKSVNNGSGSNVWIATHVSIFKITAEMQKMITMLKAQADNPKYVCRHCALDIGERCSNRIF